MERKENNGNEAGFIWNDTKEIYAVAAKSDISDAAYKKVGDLGSVFIDKLNKKEEILRQIEDNLPQDVLEKWWGA